MVLVLVTCVKYVAVLATHYTLTRIVHRYTIVGLLVKRSVTQCSKSNVRTTCIGFNVMEALIPRSTH